MNYIKLYNSIIVKSKFREKPKCYCEKHHIVPKCLGGTNEKSNLVILTAKEHFIVHHLLTKIFPTNNKIFFAFNAMNMVKRWNSVNIRYKPKLSSKEYEQLRIKRSETISKCLKGRPKSEEHRKHLSEALKGQTRELTEEQSAKLSKSLKKVIHTKEWNKKVSEGLKKHKRTAEHAANISKAKKGKHIHYNMKSAGFRVSQAGVNNYQAIKCYVEGVLIGCVNDLQHWLKTNYISHGFRNPEPWEYIRKNNYNINIDEYEQVLLYCMNKYPMMKYKKEIISKIKLENIEKFIQNNEIVYLKKYIVEICRCTALYWKHTSKSLNKKEGSLTLFFF